MNQWRGRIPLIKPRIAISRTKHYLLIVNIGGNGYTRANCDALSSYNFVKARDSWTMF